jgi:hypothetical protein
MPVLTNPKHEIVAQELAKGATQTEAYTAAGYKLDRGNAKRLTAKDNIVQRVRELQGVTAVNTEITLESLVREAEEIRGLAVKASQLSAATGALTIKAKLCGFWVDKTDNTNTNRNVDPNSISDAEIATVLRTGRNDGPAPKANGKGQLN